MRASLLLLSAVVVACAPRNTPPEVAPPAQTVRVTGAMGTGTAVNSSTRTSGTYDVRIDTIAVKLDQVWKTLPAVYGALEIPISEFDAEKNLVGNGGMKVYRRLGQNQLTKILDCGRTQIGQNADSYEIIMSVITTLAKVDSASTVVYTNIEASGQPMNYAGGQTRCRTKGELEKQLMLMLESRLLPPG
ncbi:MAG TPA: hypothetical protein VEB19_12400 [Gemmatimonadaceae bacterium]|nr:hypothetical protein [Gemmatimonadaceae bacterium]